MGSNPYNPDVNSCACLEETQTGGRLKLAGFKSSSSFSERHCLKMESNGEGQIPERVTSVVWPS